MKIWHDGKYLDGSQSSDWRARRLDPTSEAWDEIVAVPSWWKAKQVAESVAEDIWRSSSPDYPEEIHVAVIDPSGVETHWNVAVETRPVFVAEAKK